jgi:hypothetical protein
VTKPRDPLSIEAAVLEAIRILGGAEAGKAIGKQAQTVRDYSDPQRPGNVTLADAIALDLACINVGKPAPFFDLYRKKIGVTWVEAREKVPA